MLFPLFWRMGSPRSGFSSKWEPSSWLADTAFLYSHMVEKEIISLSVSLYKGVNLIQEGSTTWSDYFPKLSSPNITTLGIRASMYEIWGRHIRFTMLPYKEGTCFLLPFLFYTFCNEDFMIVILEQNVTIGTQAWCWNGRTE